jgi:hypothetical protein
MIFESKGVPNGAKAGGEKEFTIVSTVSSDLIGNQQTDKPPWRRAFLLGVAWRLKPCV